MSATAAQARLMSPWGWTAGVPVVQHFLAYLLPVFPSRVGPPQGESAIPVEAFPGTGELAVRHVCELFSLPGKRDDGPFAQPPDSSWCQPEPNTPGRPQGSAWVQS